MDIKVLTRGEAQKAMEEWVCKCPSLPRAEGDYRRVRKEIQEINKRVRGSIPEEESEKRRDYYIDAHFGLELYRYLWAQTGFTIRAATNDDFWRYLSVKVVPDVVAQRWGKDNDEHFWSRPTRIWLRSIWWYVHLAWQGDYESTEKVLDCKHFTTDTLLNFEERNGRRGTRIDTYRTIIYFYSKVPQEYVEKYSRGKDGNSDDLFRIVMKLNTAKMMVMEPELYPGGVKNYVKDLFQDAGVQWDDKRYI